MKKTWKPTVAGILLVAASVPYCVASSRWFVEPGNAPESLGGGPISPWFGLVILFPFALPLLIAAVCALMRRAWGLGFIGSLAPLLFTVLLLRWGWARMGPEYIVRSQAVPVRYAFIAVVYLLMVAAAGLLWFSRKEFKGRKSSAEHLFSPPKNLINSEG